MSTGAGLTVLGQIKKGDLDDILDMLTTTIKERQTFLGHKAFHTLSIGDKVVFNDQARPKYLKGALATITGKKRTNVTVEFDEGVGKFRAGVNITSPISIFDLVEEESFGLPTDSPPPPA